MNDLGLVLLSMPFSRGVLTAFHLAKSLVADSFVDGKLCVAEDGGLDVCGSDPELAVA